MNWSSISSFRYNKEQWFDQFILGNRKTSKEMTFGSAVDKRIQTDPTFLPSMPRYEYMQHNMRDVPFGKLLLMGTPDGINLNTKPMVLSDYKTGKKAWDQKRTDEHGQLTMYLLLLYLTQKLNPEDFDCYIHWMPTRETDDFKNIEFIKEDDIKTFKTKRSMADIVRFGKYIKETYKEMETYCQNKAN